MIKAGIRATISAAEAKRASAALTGGGTFLGAGICAEGEMAALLGEIVEVAGFEPEGEVAGLRVGGSTGAGTTVPLKAGAPTQKVVMK